MLDEEEVHQDGGYLNEQGGDDMSLGEEVGLGRIVVSKTVDGGHKLIEVLGDSLSCVFINVSIFVEVQVLKQDDDVLGDVENWGNEECAEEEVDEQGSLIKDADDLGLIPLAAYLIGEPYVQAGDEQISKYERKDGC